MIRSNVSLETCRGSDNLIALLGAIITTALAVGCGEPNCEELRRAGGAVLGKHGLCGEPTEPPRGPRLVHLEPLGALGSVATAVNERGTVVGTTDVQANGLYSPSTRAFRWNESTGATALPTLGGERSAATDVNDLDQVVGWAETEDGTTRAVLWDADGTVRDLGSLGGPLSEATAINNRGQVVGRALVSASHWGLFIWDESEGMREMTIQGIDFREGGWGRVNDINDDGVAVGSASPGRFSDLPFKWTEAEGRTLLETEGRGEALGINANGDAVGYMYTGFYDYVMVGRLWEATRTTEVGAPSDVSPGTYIHAINGDGVMVGSTTTSEATAGRATQWATPDSPQALPIEAVYSVAYDINDRGQVVGMFGGASPLPQSFVWFPGD